MEGGTPPLLLLLLMQAAAHAQYTPRYGQWRSQGQCHETVPFFTLKLIVSRPFLFTSDYKFTGIMSLFLWFIWYVKYKHSSTFIPSHSHIPPSPFAEVRTSPHRQLSQWKSQPWGVEPRIELMLACLTSHNKPTHYQLSYATSYFLVIINVYLHVGRQDLADMLILLLLYS